MQDLLLNWLFTKLGVIFSSNIGNILRMNLISWSAQLLIIFQRITFIVLMSFLFSGLTYARCPAYLYGDQISRIAKGKRSSLGLYVKYADGAWRKSMVQIDPMFRKNKLRFFENNPPDQSWQKLQVRYTDRISVRTQDFGLKNNDAKLPCSATKAVELLSAEGKYGYLVFCQEGKVNHSSLLKYKKEHSMLESFSYQYFFDDENKMLFDLLRVKDGVEYSLVASDSNLKIFADIKRFFSLTFDKDQIKSNLESYNLRALGGVARISFYLKILFFKIDLKLKTDLSFFESSAHIPMTMHLPISGRERLNHRSGMVYSWQTPALNILQPHMPNYGFASKAIDSSKEVIEKYCLNLRECSFEVKIKNKTKNLKMMMHIPVSLVRQGFYPQYMEDVRKIPKASGFKFDGVGLKTAAKHPGIFFRTSYLEKGSHDWDLWLDFDSSFVSGSKLAGCPQKLIVRSWN